MDFRSTTAVEIKCGVCVLIILSNTIELIHIFRSQKRWTNAQILFVNLALIDAALGCISIMTISVSLSQKSNRPLALSIALTYLLYLNTCELTFLVLLLSIDRWIAVKWPLKRCELMTRKRLYIGIVLSWAISILWVTLVVFLQFMVKGTTWLYVSGILTIVQTLIMTYLYYSIFVSYRRSSKAVVTFGDTSSHLKSIIAQEGDSQSKREFIFNKLKGQRSASESTRSSGENKEAVRIIGKNVLVIGIGRVEKSEKNRYSIHQRHGLAEKSSGKSQLSEVSSLIICPDAQNVTNDGADKYQDISEKRNTTQGTFNKCKESKRAACSGQEYCSQQKEKEQYGIDDNYQDRLCKGKNVVIHMSNKEKRLLKFCFAIVVCFAYSYVSPIFVLILAFSQTGNVPIWLDNFVGISILCGSLWNPILYFINQFMGKRKTPRKME